MSVERGEDQHGDNAKDIDSKDADSNDDDKDLRQGKGWITMRWSRCFHVTVMEGHVQTWTIRLSKDFEVKVYHGDDAKDINGYG